MSGMQVRKPAKTKKSSSGQIVYTYGVFDLMHSGHIRLLKKAKKLGNHLIVGLFTDDVAKSFKREPIIPFKHRKIVLEHCVFVDRVVSQNELAPDKNLKKFRPHVLAKGPGAGWELGEKTAPGAGTMRKIGGRVIKLPYHHGISTSEIIKKIKK